MKCISAEWAKLEIQRVCSCHCLDEETESDLITTIDGILAEDVKRNVYGKNLNDEFYDTDQFICSECGLHLQDWEKIIGDGEIEEFEFKFCPNCGADMRGETE